MNQATKRIVAVFGALLGVAAIDHGFFETLQGNTPTGAPAIIQAIGPSRQWWMYGGEEAFTILPTFLITGIVAITLGIALIAWCIWFVGRRYGAAVLAGLIVGLLVAGGGIGAQVLFAPFLIAGATRIDKPLGWWERILSPRTRRRVAPLWPTTLAISVACFLLALQIAIFGYFPGVDDAGTLLAICWGSLGVALLLILTSFVSGFAADIERRLSRAGKR